MAVTSLGTSYLDTPFTSVLKYSLPKINRQGTTKGILSVTHYLKKCGYVGSKRMAEEAAVMGFVGKPWKGNEIVAGAQGRLWC